MLHDDIMASVTAALAAGGASTNKRSPKLLSGSIIVIHLFGLAALARLRASIPDDNRPQNFTAHIVRTSLRTFRIPL